MNEKLLNQLAENIKQAQHILIIQPENPDGDSLGSTLALEEIFGLMDKQVTMYCPVQTPQYLRYYSGWDRIVEDMPAQYDMAILVDASSLALVERVFTPANTAKLSKSTLFIFDHHDVEVDLPVDTVLISDLKSVATGELIFQIINQLSWPVSKTAAEFLVQSIMADSLGLTTPNTTINSVKTVASLMETGVDLSELDARRREYNKKSREIFDYKGELFKRVEFMLDDQLALVVIPWEDIEKYSHAYNPSVLIIDESRMVEGVKISIALKTYPDGKVTAKIRSNHGYPISEKLASAFGGGGHPYAAGFKVHDLTLDEVKKKIVEVVGELLSD